MSPEVLHRYERYLRNRTIRRINGPTTIGAAIYLVGLVVTGTSDWLIFGILSWLAAVSGLSYVLIGHFIRTDVAFIAAALGILPSDVPNLHKKGR